MSRMFKRIASVVLVLMMLISMAPNVPLKAQAASAVPSFYVTDANGTIVQRLDQDGNGVLQLLLDSTGTPASTDSGWVPDAYYEVSGPGLFQIQLMNAGRYYENGYYTNLVWNLNRIKVTNGATLVIRLGASFIGNETITINAMSASAAFVVEHGNLIIHWNENMSLSTATDTLEIPQSYYDTVKLVLDGKNRPATTTQPLININSTSAESQAVFIANMTFRRSESRAIRAYSDQLEYLILENCTFDASISSVNGGGGAIKLDARTDRSGADSTTGKLCNVEMFGMENCNFNGVSAVSDGGAIDIAASVTNVSFNDCIFSDVRANPATTESGVARGGAIAIKGWVYMLELSRCTFDQCEAQHNGGAVFLGSHQDGDGRYSQIVDVSLNDCVFTECKSETGSGGAVAINTTVAVLKINGNSFVRCSSEENGGAIALIAKKFSGDAVSWQGSGNGYLYDWDGIPYSTIMEMYICSGSAPTEFVECFSGRNGGAIFFGANLYAERATINATMDGCAATNIGSALYLGEVMVASLDMSVTVRNGYFVDNGTDNGIPYPGAISAVSTATCNLNMHDSVMENNEGGSFYWNANVVRPSLFSGEIIPAATLTNCAINAPDVGIISSPLVASELRNVVSVNESSITAPLDISGADGRIVLNQGTVFPGEITVEGTTLNAILGQDVAYYRDGVQMAVSDEAVSLEGYVQVERGCNHVGTLVYDTCNDELHTWLCQNCGATGETPHSWESVLLTSTCDQDGELVSTCTVCGYTLREIIPATGHRYETVTVEATCTEDGSIIDICANCGDTKVQVLPAAGHGYEAVVTAPTCTESGYTTYTCSCGDTYTADETAPLGHSYETVTMEATCTEDGSITDTCANCGDTKVQVLPAAGHGYEAVVTAPTCTESGYTTYTCIRCADSYKDQITNPSGHNYEIEVIPATCTAEGYTLYSCSCGEIYQANVVRALGHSYADGVCTICGEADPDYVDPVVVPTLTLKAPALEFKDMITVNAFYTAENTEDVVEMGMITYEEEVDVVDIETADHVIPGATYEAGSDRYFSSSQGIHAKFIGDTVYLACYAKLTDGSYVYTKLAGYSPITYATNQLKNSSNVQVKQLVASMLSYGAAAQAYFGYNTDNPADNAMTEEQMALAERYTEDMVSTVAAVSAGKQGIFANNNGFSARKPAVSFEGAFCINYFFTPAYTPVDGITLYYWDEADFNAADVLTAENATGSMAMSDEGNNLYRGDIEGIAAKDLSKAVYVAAVYSDGTTTWTSGVLGYSIGAYCKSQVAKGGAIADLAKATAVYGYHAKAYFG